MNSDKLSKSGGVVIPHGLGVAPGLKNRVGLQTISSAYIIHNLINIIIPRFSSFVRLVISVTIDRVKSDCKTSD